MNNVRLRCGSLVVFAMSIPSLPASAGSLIGSFHNFDSAQNVAGGPVPGAQLPGRFAVDLSSVDCDLTGPPNTTEPHCSDRAGDPPITITLLIQESLLSRVIQDPLSQR
jgi:hypothetical protein